MLFTAVQLILQSMASLCFYLIVTAKAIEFCGQHQLYSIIPSHYLVQIDAKPLDEEKKSMACGVCLSYHFHPQCTSLGSGSRRREESILFLFVFQLPFTAHWYTKLLCIHLCKLICKWNFVAGCLHASSIMANLALHVWREVTDVPLIWEFSLSLTLPRRSRACSSQTTLWLAQRGSRFKQPSRIRRCK